MKYTQSDVLMIVSNADQTAKNLPIFSFEMSDKSNFYGIIMFGNSSNFQNGQQNITEEKSIWVLLITSTMHYSTLERREQ